MVLSSRDFVSPLELIAVTTALFGGEIDLDPASSPHANSLVQSNRFFDWRDNGLVQPWRAKNVYLYPPRDILLKHEQPKNNKLFCKNLGFKKSSQRVWLELAYEKWIRKEFNEAVIFLTSTEVALLVTQKLNFDFPLCVLKERPKLFEDNKELKPLKQSKVFGFVYYLPPVDNYQEKLQEFVKLYNNLGRVYAQ